ncbi:R-linalool synthase QH1, chloroplastic-like protein [Tanacetum coccineum]
MIYYYSSRLKQVGIRWSNLKDPMDFRLLRTTGYQVPHGDPRRMDFMLSYKFEFGGAELEVKSMCTLGEDYTTRANTLKNDVKMMISKVENPLSMLEMIDDLQRLGIAYHFQDEIRNSLKMIYYNYYETQNKWDKMDLNLKALGFRLLRQHGYQVPQEIFLDFEQKTQSLKPDFEENMVSMLNLYEASYHSYEGESILDDARDFTTKYLKNNLEMINGSLSSLVSHSLELPLHWRVPWVEAKWFMEVNEKRSGMNPKLMEFSKLNFDMLQAIHIEDLKHASRWWRNIRWDEKLTFSRDRLVEHFMWSTGFGHLPEFSLGRRTLTKVNSMITAIDDVYDVYGTLDELEQFTDVISRWEIKMIEELPDYMKICFLGFYNTINEIAYNTLTNTGFLWAGLCKAYLEEARWYYAGYTPTLQEYLDNAYESISGPVILMHVNFLTTAGSTEEILQCMAKLKNVVYYSSLIFRLADDLGTSSDELARGDTSKSIQCYMHERGATEDEARTYIKNLIMETWKKLNKERASANSQFSQEFFDHATNIPRMAQFMYSEGDGHGRPDLIKGHVFSLLFNPSQGI